MKTLIILGLFVVCVGGAFLSRPGKDDFAAYIKAQNASSQQANSLNGLAKILVGGLSTDAYLQAIVFHDHYLWTSVEYNSQTQYIGAFSHWFKLADSTAKQS